MTAKEYMIRVRKAEEELEILFARKRHYNDLILSMGSSPDADRVQHGISSKTETVAIGLVSLSAKIDEKIEEYTKIVAEAEELINKLPQEKFRKVLTFKYLCGHSWKLLQDELDYADAKSVFRCHGFALKELQKLM